MHHVHALVTTLTASLAAISGALAFEVLKTSPSPQQSRGVCSRRGMLGGLEKVFGTAAAACLVVTTTVPSSALAASPPVTRNARKLADRFNNDYDDALHPGCERRIKLDPIPSKASSNGEKNFIINFSGTDVGPDGLGPIVKLACTDETIEKYKLRSWSFEGRVNVAGSEIDAGDGIHVGKWHESTPDQSWVGIRWADGNRWVVKEDKNYQF